MPRRSIRRRLAAGEEPCALIGTSMICETQMHLGANTGQSLCTLVHVSRRRLQRRSAKAQRHATPPHRLPTPPREVVREATHVERLAYTRTQAAAALGISRSTFNRRVLPSIETVEMSWGARLVPVDELKRLVADRRRPARGRAKSSAGPGRPAAVASSIVIRIRAEHAAGRSLGQIARELNADQIPTAHGGARWWPSTVRAVLRRSAAQPVDIRRKDATHNSRLPARG